MKNINHLVNYSNKLYDFRSQYSILKPKFIDNIIYCNDFNFVYINPNKIQFYNRYTQPVIEQNIIETNYTDQTANKMFCNSDMESYYYFDNTNFDFTNQSYSIMLTFQMEKQQDQQNNEIKQNQTLISISENYLLEYQYENDEWMGEQIWATYYDCNIPLVSFDNLGNTCIGFSQDNIKNTNINIHDYKKHKIILQCDISAKKFKIRIDNQSEFQYNINNISRYNKFLIGGGYYRRNDYNYQKPWNFFNGYIYKFYIYDKIFSENQLTTITELL